MTPAIRFSEQACELLKKIFGNNKPFFVVRRDTIIENDKQFGERVYLANGAHVITVPNVQGLDLGDKLYLAEDNEVYEWHPHFDRPKYEASNNQKEALAFGLHPIVHHKDSRNS